MEEPVVLTDIVPATPDEEAIARSLMIALKDYFEISHIYTAIPKDHTEDTPLRVVRSMTEMFRGCWSDPEKHLEVTFNDSDYDEIVYMNDIGFVSNCAHHNLPFFGKVHFGYLPAKKIVGLSKIPRMIRDFALRPQVQEKLTTDIANCFMNAVSPQGCGVVIEAFHLCVMIRGIEQKPSYTKTSALRGSFKENESTKQEFLHGIKKTTEHIWP